MASQWRFLNKPISRFPCKILFAGSHFPSSLPYTQRILKQRGLEGQVEIHVAQTRKEILGVIPTVDVAVPFMEPFDAEFFAASSDMLQLVMQFGVGLEGVDIAAATSRGIAVSNIPAEASGNAQATSEFALYLAMSLLRYSNSLDARLQDKMLGGLPIPRSLYEKNCTVVGYGSVGKILCRYLTTLGAHVSVVRKRPWIVDEAGGRIIVVDSLMKALPTTDILFLACPLTPETHFLLNEETLRKLPRGSLVVNVGRGPLVEYNAINAALQSGHIGGFASDVGVGHPTKPSEPWDPHDELSLESNVIFTPHVAGYTDVAYEKMAFAFVDAIECILHGQPPPIWVNQDSS